METALVKACDTSGACVAQGTFTCGDADCVGAACGAPCNPCGLASPCPTFAATACDGAGHCVTATPGLCDDPCAGKVCGDRCTIDPPCRLATPPCMMPSLLGYCAASGGCETAPPACQTYDPCAGKVCGESCALCAPGAPCMAIMCVTACDAAGRCTCAGAGGACR